MKFKVKALFSILCRTITKEMNKVFLLRIVFSANECGFFFFKFAHSFKMAKEDNPKEILALIGKNPVSVKQLDKVEISITLRPRQLLRIEIESE